MCQSSNLASEPLSVRVRRLRVRYGLQGVVCSSRLSLCMVSLQQPAFRLPHLMQTAHIHCAGIRRGAWWHDLHSVAFIHGNPLNACGGMTCMLWHVFTAIHYMSECKLHVFYIHLYLHSSRQFTRLVNASQCKVGPVFAVRSCKRPGRSVKESMMVGQWSRDQ